MSIFLLRRAFAHGRETTMKRGFLKKFKPGSYGIEISSVKQGCCWFFEGHNELILVDLVVCGNLHGEIFHDLLQGGYMSMVDLNAETGTVGHIYVIVKKNCEFDNHPRSGIGIIQDPEFDDISKRSARQRICLMGYA